MSTITATDVKKLRDETGAGMMDCKMALSESKGDFEEAIAYLRKKGQKLSEKRAGREAKEGVVIASVSQGRKKGVIVKVACETDFVAKNEDFINFGLSIAEKALEEFPDTREELLNTRLNELTIEQKIKEQIGVIGEKIELADYETIEAERVVSYIHMGYKSAVLVGLNQEDEKFDEPGRNIAMQIAAMTPIALDKEAVDQSVIDRELEIGREQALNEGKPEQIVDKIAQGKLEKFYKDNTLLEQQYVKDSSMTVRQYLKSLHDDLQVSGFKHVTLG